MSDNKQSFENGNQEHSHLPDIIEETKEASFMLFSKTFKEEIKTNIKISFPVIITNLLQYSLNIETQSFCGRLTRTELEGVGLAISLLSALGWCVSSGMVTACDTMFAQSFGSENKKRTGLFLQRGLLLLNLIPICLWALHINFEPLLILLHQDPDVSRVTGDFMIAFTPGLTFQINYLLLARYMQDQGCLWPPVVAAIFGNIFNICCQLLFVIQLNYGFKAAALSHAFSYGFMTMIEIIYILKSKFYIETWPGFQLEALYDWSNMFRLGLAGIGHTTFEVIIWEASVFMGGLIGNIELATQSIMQQLLCFTFMVYSGIGIASNIRVGQCLGANRPYQAKCSYRAGLVTTAVATFFTSTMIMILRYQIPYIFTDKQDVIDMVIDVLPYMYFLYFSDPFSGVANSALRGCGRQFTGCIIMVLAYYIMSLPTSIVLAFVYQFSIKGIWFGISIGSGVSVILCLLLLECQNWNKQAYLAQKRVSYTSSRNQEEESENKKLLPNFDMEEDKGIKIPSHIRTPSHPIMCSIDIVNLPKPRSQMDKRIIIKRIATASCVVTFFIFGLLIHNLLPTEIYRNTNSTQKRV